MESNAYAEAVYKRMQEEAKQKVDGELERRRVRELNQRFLHEVYSGNVEEVTNLLASGNGVDPSFTTGDGETALHLACKNNNILLVGMLINHGWDYGKRCAWLDTVPYKMLSAYTQEEAIEVTEELKTQNRTCARSADDFENNLLHFSCEDGDMDGVIEKLSDKSDVWYDRAFVHDEELGETAIHGAAKNGHGRICTYLIKKGWKLQRFPVKGFTVSEVRERLPGAADENRMALKGEAERYLKGSKSSPLRPRHAGYAENAELWFLAQAGLLDDVMRVLTDKRTLYDREFCYEIDKQETALHIAALHGHKELTEYLIKQKWDPEKKNREGLSPAGLAVKFLDNVRNGVKRKKQEEEWALLHKLSARADRLAAKADAGWDWIKKHGDGELSGSLVLYKMIKPKMSANPTWTLKEKKEDLERKTLEARNKVSIGRQLHEHILNISRYPVYTLKEYKLMIDRVQDQGDGSFYPWPEEIEGENFRTVDAYETKMKFGKCWRCQSTVYPVAEQGHKLPNEARCSFCWSQEGGLFDSYLKASRI